MRRCWLHVCITKWVDPFERVGLLLLRNAGVVEHQVLWRFKFEWKRKSVNGRRKKEACAPHGRCIADRLLHAMYACSISQKRPRATWQESTSCLQRRQRAAASASHLRTCCPPTAPPSPLTPFLLSRISHAAKFLAFLACCGTVSENSYVTGWVSRACSRDGGTQRESRRG